MRPSCKPWRTPPAAEPELAAEAEWFCGGGKTAGWKYSAEDAAKLEAAYLTVQAGRAVADVVLTIDNEEKGAVYDANVVTMKQTNRKDKSQRSMRRSAPQAATAAVAATQAEDSAVADDPEIPAALTVVGASLEATNGVYDLELHERQDDRRVWTRRQRYGQREAAPIFKIRWSTKSESWVIDRSVAGEHAVLRGRSTQHKRAARRGLGRVRGRTAYATAPVVRAHHPALGNDEIDEIENDENGIALMLHASENNLAAAAEILERDPSVSSFQLQKEVHWSVSVDAYSRFCIGDTPLIVAAKRGNTEVLQLLIENGALLEMRDSGCHSTALAWAAYEKKPMCVRVLCDAGADVDGQSTSVVIRR